MRMKHNYDIYGNTESAVIYLAKPGKRIFCALNGIDTPTVFVTLRTNNTAELTFTVNKYIDGEISSGYEELDEMMELRQKIDKERRANMKEFENILKEKLF